MGDRIMLSNAQAITRICHELVEQTHKIQPTEVAVISGEIVKLATEKDSTYIPAALTFNDCVQTLTDVPIPFLWAAMRKNSTNQLISQWSSKSSKFFKTAFTYVTGTYRMIMVG